MASLQVGDRCHQGRPCSSKGIRVALRVARLVGRPWRLGDERSDAGIVCSIGDVRELLIEHRQVLASLDEADVHVTQRTLHCCTVHRRPTVRRPTTPAVVAAGTSPGSEHDVTGGHRAQQGWVRLGADARSLVDHDRAVDERHRTERILLHEGAPWPAQVAG